MAELGLLGLPYPEEYGGAGMDTLSYAIAVGEVARVCVPQPSRSPRTSRSAAVPSRASAHEQSCHAVGPWPVAKGSQLRSVSLSPTPAPTPPARRRP